MASKYGEIPAETTDSKDVEVSTNSDGRDGEEGLDRDEKRRLITELYVHTYRVFLGKTESFFETWLSCFSGNDDQEYAHEFYEAYKQYQKIMEESFSDFADSHGFDDVQGLFSMIAEASLDDKRSNKMVKKMLRATDFKNFVRLMHYKVRDSRKGK